MIMLMVFILNAIETRRIELVGIKVWGGMVDELIFKLYKHVDIEN